MSRSVSLLTVPAPVQLFIQHKNIQQRWCGRGRKLKAKAQPNHVMSFLAHHIVHTSQENKIECMTLRGIRLVWQTTVFRLTARKDS